MPKAITPMRFDGAAMLLLVFTAKAASVLRRLLPCSCFATCTISLPHFPFTHCRRPMPVKSGSGGGTLSLAEILAKRREQRQQQRQQLVAGQQAGGQQEPHAPGQQAGGKQHQQQQEEEPHAPGQQASGQQQQQHQEEPHAPGEQAPGRQALAQQKQQHEQQQPPDAQGANQLPTEGGGGTQAALGVDTAGAAPQTAGSSGSAPAVVGADAAPL